jgi:hypothetical protein
MRGIVVNGHAREGRHDVDDARRQIVRQRGREGLHARQRQRIGAVAECDHDRRIAQRRERHARLFSARRTTAKENDASQLVVERRFPTADGPSFDFRSAVENRRSTAP